MLRIVVSLLALSLATAVVQALEIKSDPTEWSWLDRILREEADAVAFHAAEFDLAGDPIAAADLYREAVQTLSGSAQNGWRFHSYRHRYKTAARSGTEATGVGLPGAEFDGEKWDSFDPALLIETVIPNVEFRDKPLSDCLDWLVGEFNALNSKGHLLAIRLAIPEDIEHGGITLRLTDTSFKEALRYTTALVQMRLRLGDNNLILEPITSHSRDLATLILKVDSNIAEEQFGSCRHLGNELGLTLGPGEGMVFQKGTRLIVRMRDEHLVQIALWLKMLDRISDPEAGLVEGLDRLRMAEHYSSIGEEDLRAYRHKQARETVRWLKRLHPRFEPEKVASLGARCGE